MTNPQPAASRDTHTTPPRERLFNVAPVTLVLTLVIVTLHLVRVFALSPADNRNLILGLGFIPMEMQLTGLHSVWPWLKLITYGLLHADWMHLVVNMAGLLAFGSVVERNIGRIKYLLILLAGTVAGALLHFAIFSDSLVMLIGISAGISALFAVVLGAIQQKGWRGLLPGIVTWLLLNVLVGFLGVPGQPGLALAWVAHMGGFFAGLLFLPFLFPVYYIIFIRGSAHD